MAGLCGYLVRWSLVVGVSSATHDHQSVGVERVSLAIQSEFLHAVTKDECMRDVGPHIRSDGHPTLKNQMWLCKSDGLILLGCKQAIYTLCFARWKVHLDDN